MITISVDNEKIMTAFKRLIRSGQNPEPVLAMIGDDLVESTKQRIDSKGPGPNREVWKENSPVTMALAEKYGTEKRLGNHPLIASGLLMESGLSRLVAGDTLYVGVNRFTKESEGTVAATLHFGTTRAGKHHNITIPARPYLGISDADAKNIKSLISRELKRVIKP